LTDEQLTWIREALQAIEALVRAKLEEGKPAEDE
jgi:hypothetical protein